MSLSEEVQARLLPVLYKNHRGVIACRAILPKFVWYGDSQYHTGAQWFLRSDEPTGDPKTTKRDRDFALDGFLAIGEPQIERIWGDGSTARATKREAAVATLESAGYTYTEGAQLWRPPLGPAPDFEALDKRAALIAELRTQAHQCAIERQHTVADLLRQACAVIEAAHPLAKDKADAGA
jgi:hypothetical protein